MSGTVATSSTLVSSNGSDAKRLTDTSGLSQLTTVAWDAARYASNARWPVASGCRADMSAAYPCDFSTTCGKAPATGDEESARSTVPAGKPVGELADLEPHVRRGGADRGEVAHLTIAIPYDPHWISAIVL